MENVVIIEAPSVDPAEAAIILEHSHIWWDEKGEYKAQILFDRVVVPFYIDEIAKSKMPKKEFKNTSKPFKGLDVLEVGCGGGIIGELMGKTGCNYVGIDINSVIIDVAKKHLLLDPSLKNNVKYLLESVEEHSKKNIEKYDAVIINTVIAHVVDHDAFLKCCTNCLKPGGSIFLSSVNKTWMSWFLGIVLAEGIVRSVPKGAHAWDKLAGTSYLTRILKTYKCKTVAVKGVMYSFIRDEWYLNNWGIPFYAFHASKDM